jgi:hypothetical protein
MGRTHLTAIRIRRANTKDTEAIAKVHVDTWRTAYHGILPNGFLSNLSYDQARRSWETGDLNPNSQNAVYVVEDGSGDIVGFAICGPDRDLDPILATK